MNINLKFNNKLYSLKLDNVDIWTHEASMEDETMQNFIIEILTNNDNIKKAVIAKFKIL